VAGVIASRTANLMRKPPAMAIGVQTNLTPADAYFSGLAAQFEKPATGQNRTSVQLEIGPLLCRSYDGYHDTDDPTAIVRSLTSSSRTSMAGSWQRLHADGVPI
jgi:hypothetical protein